MPFLSEIGTWILSSFNSLLPDCLVDRPTSHAAHDWGTNRLCQTVDRNDVSRVVLVIEAAVHYFRHLRSSTPRVSELQLRSGITVEFLLLEECEEVDPDTTLKLIVPDKTGKNLLVNGEVTVLANGSETRLYGIKITSSLKHLLHCSVFFFDSDFSVISYYQPAVGGNPDPPLDSQGEGALTIGFGAGSSQPQLYTLQDGQDFDLGFLKIFVSNVPLDLSHIPRESPFESTGKAPAPRGAHTRERTKASLWDTIVIPVKQRRV
ncbi:hypothetical protein PHLCEN_2v10655 [Hermanssonia centrifuga]|uniref:Uncharacterized protein n=1 Tax=Hermanssonia centrifuga TaxID=98765 RepID=A0A2R6NMA1_9APHY|nr:hypothetical protein PHLCEN_2v10655 [Hermanssonia centrifuga]